MFNYPFWTLLIHVIKFECLQAVICRIRVLKIQLQAKKDAQSRKK